MVVVIRGVDDGDKAQNQLGLASKARQPVHRYDPISCGRIVDESSGERSDQNCTQLLPKLSRDNPHSIHRVILRDVSGVYDFDPLPE